MFDLNELPSEEEVLSLDDDRLNSLKEVEILANSKSQSTVEPSFEPFIGQTFLSEEEAFIFYQSFANQCGFSVRKDRTNKKDGKIVRRDFFCHRGRSPLVKEIDPTKVQRNKMSYRCNCTAHMRIKLRRFNEIFPEEWHVITVVLEHNHPLLSSSQIRFLPSSRVISLDDQKCIFLLKEAGLTVRQIIRVLELKKNIHHGELPFLERDIRNLFTKVRKEIVGNDVENLLEYFKSCKLEDSKFQYVVKVDPTSKLEHLFWSLGSCVEWYEKYGDVVVFDTTYKVNMYDMPCGVFVGINNHGKTVLFGFALLRNETVSTFKWLMKTFVATMKRSPKTIITDQDPWMTEAIASELPLTKHSFCIWHITSKFSGWFISILRNLYPKWCHDFYLLYKMDNIEEFESQWDITVQKYDLQDNRHIKGLYEIKKFWVPAYLRNCFFGGMTTTGRSEYINGFIKRFISSNTTLRDLAKQVDVAVREIKQKNLHDDMLAIQMKSALRLMSPLEEQASQVLTPFSFEKFKKESSRSSQYTIIYTSGNDFVVRYYKEDSSNKYHKVFSDENTTLCSCKEFEFSGVLCRHIIRVFQQKDINKIPSMYLPLRWRLQDHENEVYVSSEQTLIEPEAIIANDILCPPKSKTKGRPKKRRIKGGKEISKHSRYCSKCRKTGHYANCCPQELVKIDGSLKKKNKSIINDTDLNPIFCVKY